MNTPHGQVHDEQAYVAADTGDMGVGITDTAPQAVNGVETVPHLGAIQDGMLPDNMQAMQESYEAYGEDPMRLVDIPQTRDAQVGYYDHSGANVGLMPGQVHEQGVYMPDVADLQGPGQVTGVDGQGIGVGVGIGAPLDPQSAGLGQGAGQGDDEYKDSAQPQQFYKKRQSRSRALHPTHSHLFPSLRYVILTADMQNSSWHATFADAGN
jgi:hypothetical protein